MNGREPTDPRKNPRNFMPLKRERTRLIPVDRIPTPKLWGLFFEEMTRAERDCEAHRRREAFYAIVRAREVAEELYLRGEQLSLFAALGPAPDGPYGPQPADR